MGNKNSGNHEGGGLTAKQKTELLRKYRRGRKLNSMAEAHGLTVAQLVQEYGVSSQYIWLLDNPRPKKTK